MNNSIVLCTICFLMVLLAFCDRRWGLEIHLRFNGKLGKILGYNRFSAGGIEVPKVQLIVWSKAIFQTIGKVTHVRYEVVNNSIVLYTICFLTVLLARCVCIL